MTGLWRRLREQLRDDRRVFDALDVPAGPSWHPPGLDVVESPLLPEGTFIIGAHGAGGGRTGDDDQPAFRFVEPLWEPPAPPPWRSQYRDINGDPGGMAHAVYVDERRKALDFLERLLDDTCHDLGLDPDAAWKDARREQTRAAAWRARQVLYAVEARLAFSIQRPSDFMRAVITP